MTTDFVEVSGGKGRRKLEGIFPSAKIVRGTFEIEHLKEVKFLMEGIVSPLSLMARKPTINLSSIVQVIA